MLIPTISFSSNRYINLSTIIVVFCLMFFSAGNISAETQAENSPLIRIGLAKQKELVQLQGNVPIAIGIFGMEPVIVPENVPLTISRMNNQIQVNSHQQTLLQINASARLRISPVPNQTTEVDATKPSLISLLGPSRHYDGKADRPYRGTFELISSNFGFTIVNIIDIESYLFGVVSSEMNPAYPLEALKAQAIAARSYAMKNLRRMAILGYDLDDTAACQVYGGYFSEDPRTTQAVKETNGQLLTYHGQIIDAVYSSTCGGFTESAKNAWGREIPYLQGVSDAPPNAEEHFTHPASESEWSVYFKNADCWNCLQPKQARLEAFRWVKVMSYSELIALLPTKYRCGELTDIVPLTRGYSGRITKVKLIGSESTIIIDKELNIRSAFGKLRSSAFSIDTYRDTQGKPMLYIFWGAGWGHGLGMCQVGAVGLAEQGWTFDKILAQYYQGASITKIIH